MDSVEPAAGRKLGCFAKGVVWVLVVLATVAVGFYQRVTGPTYPVKVAGAVGGVEVGGKLPRTHPGEGGPSIALKTSDESIQGVVLWRKYPTDEPLRRLTMSHRDGVLSASLPHFPPAAKVAYEVRLTKGSESATLPPHPAVLRYRGDVPAALVIGHVLLMFLGLLIGLRLIVSALLNEPQPQRWFRLLVPSLLLGGFVMGPAMSWYSFGEIWTGWPVGSDLTDTKTLGATLVWLAAWFYAVRRPERRRLAIVAAAVVMLAAYLIPHSAAGSELDWSKAEATTDVRQ